MSRQWNAIETQWLADRPSQSGTDWPLAVPPSLLREDVESIPWVHRTGTFRALGHSFAIRSTDELLGCWFSAIFAHLADEGPPSTVYSIIGPLGDDRPYAVYVDDDFALQPPRVSDVVAFMMWRINATVVETAGDLVLLHAAAVARDDHGVILAAPMEAGKTTLAAGLVIRGLDYLTDEAAAIDPAGLELVAYPKPMSVDEGSWQVLSSLRPHVPGALEPFFADQWQVSPTTIRPDAVIDRALPRLVIFPRYDPAAATSIRELRRSEGLVRLLEQTFHFPVRAGHKFAVLGRLVRNVPCYELVSSDLGAACDAVEGLLDSHTRPRLDVQRS